jgi:hypothetical protein
MSSKEKKEIIQNGIFGVAAGMVMGGPAGAITAGVTAVGLAYLEEKYDQNLRRREWERRHPDIIKEEKKKEEIIENIRRKGDIYPEISQMMRDNNSGIIFKIGKVNVDINPDFNRCVSYNGGCSIKLNPDNNKYVKIKIYDNSDWVFDSSILPYINGSGIILNSSDFKLKLENEKNNPNLDKFIIDNGWGKEVRSGYGSVTLLHRIRHMFTIDSGKTFYVLW